ncbi:hypothetical protein [Nocardia sp. NPDC004260]
MPDAVDIKFDLHRVWCERFRAAVGDAPEATKVESGAHIVPWVRDGRQFAASFGLKGVQVFQFGESGDIEASSRLGGNWLIPLVSFYRTGSFEGGSDA